MNLKRRVDKIEGNKQPTRRPHICFQNPGERLEDAKKRVLKGDALGDDWFIIRWVD